MIGMEVGGYEEVFEIVDHTRTVDSINAVK
jgi:hypothetical protein